MRKSMASSWPSSCLIVALAGIICLSHSFSPVHGTRRRNGVEIDCVKQGSPSWVDDRREYPALYLKKCGYEGHFERAIIKLGQALNKHADSDESKTLSSYLVDKALDPWIVERLLSAVEEYSEFESASEGIDCTQEHGTKLVQLFVASCPVEGLHEFVGDYYARFLQECGFEDHFRTAIDTSKLFSKMQWDSPRLATLYSYVEKSCHNLFSHGPVQKQISVIKKISQLGSISQQTDCTDELQTSLLDLVDESKLMEELEHLVHEYFAHYLSECGFEGSFQKAIDNLRPHQLALREVTCYGSLSQYFRSQSFVTKTEKLSVFEIIKDISMFDKFSTQTHCTEERLNKLVDWRQMGKPRIGYLSYVMGSYLALNLEECGLERRFQKRESDSLDQNSYDDQDKSKHDTLYNFLFGRNDKESKRAKSIIKELLNSDGSSTKNELPEEVM